DSAGGVGDAHPGVIVQFGAGLRALDGSKTVAIELGGVDLLAVGQVGGELAQTLAKLAAGADGVAALVVIEGDGEVDQRLEKEAARAALGRPDLLEDLVTDEELAAVEQVDAVPQAGVHGQRFRTRSGYCLSSWRSLGRSLNMT